ncbi:MAG: serine hydrolase domain-containing protein, partial [Bacteroidota bacterium]
MRNFTALISFVLLFPLLSYTQVSPEKKLKIDKLMESWGNSNSPGAAIGIIQNGELIFSEGYGMANLDYGIPINSDAKFYLASIAKQFTATSVALLAIEGKINLDDNIRDYFPEIPDYGHKITIRNLIHHTSGLRDYLSIMYLSGSSFEDYFNNEDGLKIIARQKALNFVPNQEYLYSNSNYILLAELVKRVSGMSIRAYADQHIFKPLGMKNTYFNDNHKQISGNRVVSYNKNEEGNYERYVQNFDGHGDGGMISTINDLYLWDQNFYHKRVGGQALQDIILSRQRLANGFLHAYSFGIEHGQYKGLKINMHGGNFLGFNHHFTRFSDNNFSVIVLANTSEVD